MRSGSLLSAILAISSLVASSNTNHSDDQSRRNRRLVRTKDGDLLPADVIDIIRYSPESIDEINFADCSRELIEEILGRLPEESQELILRKLEVDRAVKRIRDEADSDPAKPCSRQHQMEFEGHRITDPGHERFMWQQAFLDDDLLVPEDEDDGFGIKRSGEWRLDSEGQEELRADSPERYDTSEDENVPVVVGGANELSSSSSSTSEGTTEQVPSEADLRAMMEAMELSDEMDPIHHQNQPSDADLIAINAAMNPSDDEEQSPPTTVVPEMKPVPAQSTTTNVRRYATKELLEALEVPGGSSSSSTSSEQAGAGDAYRAEYARYMDNRRQFYDENLRERSPVGRFRTSYRDGHPVHHQEPARTAVPMSEEFVFAGGRVQRVDLEGFREIGTDRLVSPPPHRNTDLRRRSLGRRGRSPERPSSQYDPYANYRSSEVYPMSTMSHSMSHGSKTASSKREPVINKDWSKKHRGIKNAGNTCYISSVIQALFHIPQIKNALQSVSLDEVPFTKRQPFQQLQKVFDELDKFVYDGHPKGASFLAANPVIIPAELLLVLASDRGVHEQGDASEVFSDLINLCGAPLESLFQMKTFEAVMEDRPLGFLFRDLQESTIYVSLNVLDHQYTSLQQFVDFGVATAVQLSMDPKDQKHQEYLQTSQFGVNQVPAVSFGNIINAGELVCFHLIRYSTSSNHPAKEGAEVPLNLSARNMAYPEDLNILGKSYTLQSVVVHETFGLLSSFKNNGHYFTIARTTDEDEEWVILDDSTATVTTKEVALSKVKTATLLFYSRVADDDEIESIDTSTTSAVVQRSQRELVMMRQAISEAMMFSNDFALSLAQQHSHQQTILQLTHQFGKQAVRSALALHQQNSTLDVAGLAKTFYQEKMLLSKQVLLEEFQCDEELIDQALMLSKGSLNKARDSLNASLGQQ